MNPTQVILNWLSETLNRFFIKQPKYFKYWTWLSYAAMAISGIPYVLVQFNIHLPEPFATLSNKAVTWCAFVMLFMSKLAVKTPVVGQTETGLEVKVTDEKKMPFSAKVEKKEIAEKIPSPEVLDVPEPEKIKDQ